MAIKLELTGKCANCSYIDLYAEDPVYAYGENAKIMIDLPTVQCTHGNVCGVRGSVDILYKEESDKSGDKTLIEQYRNVMKAFERMLMDDQERKTASGEGSEE